MAASSATPSDLTITPRNRRYGASAAPQRWWWGGDPVGTALYNALSVSFPPGERFFIETLRALRLDASPPLQKQIAAFVAQEATHAREHAAFNRHILESGYEVGAAEARARDLIATADGYPILVRLAVAIGLEHFTAILGRALLTDEAYLAGVSADVRRFWRWHAAEEVEHKAVLFDAYLIAAAKRLSPFWRWALRARAMAAVTPLFLTLTARNIADFLGQDGVERGRGARRLLWLLLVRPGIARRVLGAYLAWYRPGFHPWRHDDRPLLRAVEGEFAQEA